MSSITGVIFYVKAGVCVYVSPCAQAVRPPRGLQWRWVRSDGRFPAQPRSPVPAQPAQPQIQPH